MAKVRNTWENIKGLLKGRQAKTRKTHCVKGHEFTEENTYIAKSGSRVCRICKKSSSLRSYLFLSGGR